ncbi:hypothetical protein Tco_1352093 [Tanacetum coccineum]
MNHGDLRNKNLMKKRFTTGHGIIRFNDLSMGIWPVSPMGYSGYVFLDQMPLENLLKYHRENSKSIVRQDHEAKKPIVSNVEFGSSSRPQQVSADVAEEKG